MIFAGIWQDYYGPRNPGANYGILYSAWGLAGFLMPGYFAGILDEYRASTGLLACLAFLLAALIRKPRLSL